MTCVYEKHEIKTSFHWFITWKLLFNRENGEINPCWVGGGAGVTKICGWGVGGLLGRFSQVAENDHILSWWEGTSSYPSQQENPVCMYVHIYKYIYIYINIYIYIHTYIYIYIYIYMYTIVSAWVLISLANHNLAFLSVPPGILKALIIPTYC